MEKSMVWSTLGSRTAKEQNETDVTRAIISTNL